jgi:protein-disulfide isomerase
MEGLNAPKNRRFLMVALAILLIPVFFVIIFFLWQTISFYREIRDGNTDSLSDRRLQRSISSRVANAQVTAADRALIVPSSGTYPELGSRSAPMTVVVFVDYQCPYCQSSAAAIRSVAAAMKDKVHLIIRDFPIAELHDHAQTAAVSADCVLAQGQSFYWKYFDLIYASESELDHESADELRQKAQSVGVNLAAYDACITQGQNGTIQKKINTDIENGLRVGVQGTPTFFVNGVKFEGAVDANALTREIQTVMQQGKK